MGHTARIRSAQSAAPTGLFSSQRAQSHAPKLADGHSGHSSDAHLRLLQREHEQMRRTFFEVAQTQRRLCGPRYLRRGSFELAGEIFPVNDLSGDFVSIFEAGNEVVFAIGDISGKGLRAALWFSQIVSMLRLQALAQHDPAAVMAAMNRDLLSSGLEFPMTSVFLGRLKTDTGEITYCNAGHPPAVLNRLNAEAEKLQEGGPILGVVADAPFRSGTRTLQPGDSLLAYSDGIAECRSASGPEYGMSGLLQAADANRGAAATPTLFSMLAAVEDFAGDHTREDDMALLVVHRLED